MTCPSQQGWKQPPQGPHASPAPPSTLGTSRCPCTSGLDAPVSSRSAPGAMPHLLTHGKDKSGEKTPSSGLLALLAQPALRAMRLGSSYHSRGCIQPRWVPFLLHSYYVFEVTSVLFLTAMEPSSSQGFAEKNRGRCGQAAVGIRTQGQSRWDAA